MICRLDKESAQYIAFNMRDIDVREIFATHPNDSRLDFADECMAIGGWCVKNKQGIPVMMLGVHECWPNVGNAWCVATDEISNIGIEATKAAKFVLSKYEHLHRIQAFSASFHDVSHRWLERLGFKRGPVFEKLGKNGEDFIVFEIVR